MKPRTTMWALMAAASGLFLRSVIQSEADSDRRLEMWRGLGLHTFGEMTALVDAGVSVNDRGYEGKTLLMVAAEWGMASSVRYLLGLGADPHLTDERGRTALMLARGSGKSKVVTILQRAKKKPAGERRAIDFNDDLSLPFYHKR